MSLEITLKNYRRFTQANPARFRIEPGFTALIGTNNAGKSSILKMFFEFRELISWLSRPESVVMNATKSPQRNIRLGGKVDDQSEVFTNLLNGDISLIFETAHDRVKHELGRALVTKYDVSISKSAHDLFWFCKIFALDQTGENLLESIEQLQHQVFNNGNGAKPADAALLCGELAPLAQTMYVGPFRNAINLGASDDYFDIKIGTAFISDWDQFKLGALKTRNEAAKALERDIARIFGFREFEMNASPNGRSLKVFVDGRSYRLEEMGGGLAQFVVVLANVALRRPDYLLIDEPESNLHPSLQLDFLTTLGSYCNKGVIFATHSLGLARAAADRIYAVLPQVDGSSKVELYDSLGRLSEFVGALSFSGHPELGFQKLLLVEGSHDVKTIQQFLRFYKKEHSVVVLPLGGSSLINGEREGELRELKRITSNVSVLIDSERGKMNEPLSKSRQAFVELCRGLEFKTCVLDRRAIENYFTDAAIKTTKGEKYSSLELYQLLRDKELAWGKAENWRIANAMTKSDLDCTDLGKFLDSI